MKTSKICPKCSSNEILRIPGKTEAYGAGNNIRAGMTIFSHVPVDRYICCRCGYSEEWIQREHIPKLKDYYK